MQSGTRRLTKWEFLKFAVLSCSDQTNSKSQTWLYVFCQCDLQYHLQVWSGAALTGFLPSLLHLSLSLVTAAQGETGLSEGEWQAKPVLTRHLKPPHKYRLPFPISKQPIHLCLHAYTLLHVMSWGVSLKMTMGHLADSQRVGLWCAALHCSSVQLQILCTS